jgi:hypothetical protein
LRIDPFWYAYFKTCCVLYLVSEGVSVGEMAGEVGTVGADVSSDFGLKPHAASPRLKDAAPLIFRKSRRFKSTDFF